MRFLRGLVLGFGVLCGVVLSLSTSVCEASSSTYRFALLIGNNYGGGRVASLRYAEGDVRKVKNLLTQLGGYSPRRIWLLTGRTAEVVQRTMRVVQKSIQKLQKQHGRSVRIVLFVYYSGHAQRGHLLLGRSSLSFRKIKRFMRTSGASLRLAVFDACESGRLTQRKGLKRRAKQFRFPQVRLNPTAAGEVIISATGERESAHEDSTLRGGIFTHYFLSGLRGAADRNHDGHVTLEEAYLYSYNRSLERTILSSRGPQRARFAKTISGYGSLILTRLSKQQAWLRLHKNVEGEFFIWNATRDVLFAEVQKNKGKASMIALPSGKYILQWRRKGGVYHKAIQLRRNQRFRLGLNGNRLAYWRPKTVRGGDSKQVQAQTSSGDWLSFQGQMVGASLGATYTIGFSGVDQGVLHQGPQLHLILPLDSVWEGRFALFFQLGYQQGAVHHGELFHYTLHLAQVDVGAVWTWLERPHWWIGGGAVVRGNILLQSLPKRTGQEAQELLSSTWGLAGMLRVQYGFGERWFLQWSVLGGARLLNLGGLWSLRWELESSLGIGMRI